MSKSWQISSGFVTAPTMLSTIGNARTTNGVMAPYLRSGTPWSLLDVNKKDLHLGLSMNWFASIIVSLDKGVGYERR
jgi:hypothetical protein